MKKYDVLIVDDEEVVAFAIRDSLKVLEIYNGDVALSGNEALEKVSKKSYDAFLVDQIMPGMLGTDFIRKLITIVKNPLVYIITAEDDGVALSAAETGGIPIHRYIQKPWQQSVFTVDLREDLRERELMKQLSESMEKFSHEQKEIQLELYAAQKQLVTMEKHESSLASGIAVALAANHELNNINAGFSACTYQLEMMSEDPKSSLQETQLQVLRKVRTSQEKLSNRLKEYTEFLNSLFEKNKAPKKSVLLRDIIEKSMNDIMGEINLGSIIVHDTVPADIYVKCHPMQLRHAFFQILKNSIEAMPAVGTLNINAHYSDETVILTIADTGKGIPENNIDLVFLPLFTKTKIYGGKGGTIAHKILVDNHNAKINIESYTMEMIQSGKFPGKTAGTAVTVLLPQ